MNEKKTELQSIFSVFVFNMTVNLTHLHKSGGSDAGIDNALRSSLVEWFLYADHKIHLVRLI